MAPRTGIVAPGQGMMTAGHPLRGTDRVMGIDPGERRIGIALSDPAGIIASPHDVIDRRREDVVSRLRDMIDSYAIRTIVIGLPSSLAGGDGPAARRVRAFGEKIAADLAVAVEYQDERFTTVQAEAALLEGNVGRADRRRVVDKVAAALMHQGYLDRRANAVRPDGVNGAADPADEDG